MTDHVADLLAAHRAMQRAKPKPFRVSTGVTLDLPLIERVAQAGASLGVSRSKLIERLVEDGIERYDPRDRDEAPPERAPDDALVAGVQAFVHAHPHRILRRGPYAYLDETDLAEAVDQAVPVREVVRALQDRGLLVRDGRDTKVKVSLPDGRRRLYRILSESAPAQGRALALAPPQHGSPVFGPDDLTFAEDGEPLVRDLVLAERLGFDRPRAIRDLIRSHHEEIASFGGVGQVCRAARQTCPTSGGRPSVEFHLNRQQAMLVTILSKAPLASRVRRQMIEVFDAVTRAAPPPRADRSDVAALAATVERLAEQVAVLTGRIGTPRPMPRARSSPKRCALDAFVVACLVADPAARTPARVLYRAYCAFAAASRIAAMTETRFGRDMKSRTGPSAPAFINGRNCRAYHGWRLRLAPPAEPVP